MKVVAPTALKVIGKLFVFVAILNASIAALLLIIMVLRYPPALIAVLLICWAVNRWKASR
jgi:hypothetical protein